MTNLCCDVLKALQGKTLATAESLTGGGIGAAITAVPGSSEVYKGGVISYTNEVKHKVLGISLEDLDFYGAVSAPVAKGMASGVRGLLQADVSVAVTGLAGPGRDGYGNAVGTVFIAYQDDSRTEVRDFRFHGTRADIRYQTQQMAFAMILEYNK